MIFDCLLANYAWAIILFKEIDYLVWGNILPDFYSRGEIGFITIVLLGCSFWKLIFPEIFVYTFFGIWDSRVPTGVVMIISSRDPV